MKTLFRSGLWLVLFPLALLAQEKNSTHTLKLAEGAASPPAKLEDFAWLAGHWVGTGFGGAHVEEVWLPPLGSSMAGMFRLIADGRARVHEIFALVPVGDTVELRLKHFTSELKGWEQKDEFVIFKLVGVAPGAAHFEGLTFQVDADGVLRVWLETKARDGTLAEQEMIYRRQD